ncbi:MAG: protease pro-enzyme activation domain-containing protein, partial [Acidimicrobiales bacterium]
MSRYRGRIGRMAVAVAAGGLAVGMMGSGVAAAAPAAPGGGGSGGEVTVPQGPNPAHAPGAAKTGPTSPGTKLTVSFILKARNLSQLQAQVSQGWSGPYLTTQQFAATYGQPASVVQSLQRYLSSYGIKSSAYPDGLDVTATGTAAQFNQALSIVLTDYQVPSPPPKGPKGAPGSRRGPQSVHASPHNPRVPRDLGSVILSVLGLTNYAPFVSQAVPAVGHPQTATPSTSSGIPAGQLTPAYFVHHYGLAPVEAAGHVGAGRTIGIVTL